MIVNLNYLELICTGSDDRSIIVNKIINDEFKFDYEAVCTLKGHKKKVSLLKFNPVAEDILASLS